MCIWTITFKVNELLPKCLACWFILTLSKSFLKFKVIGHSSQLQEGQNIAKVIGIRAVGSFMFFHIFKQFCWHTDAGSPKNKNCARYQRPRSHLEFSGSGPPSGLLNFYDCQTLKGLLIFLLGPARLRSFLFTLFCHMGSCKFRGSDSEKIFGPHCSTMYVDAAYCYRPSSVVCRSVCRSVYQLVGLSVTLVSPAKTAEPIKIGLRTWVVQETMY